MPNVTNNPTNTQPSYHANASNEPVGESAKATTNAATQIAKPSASNGLPRLLSKQAPVNPATVAKKPNSGKFARLLESRAADNQPASKRIRTESHTIEEIIENSKITHNCLFDFYKQRVDQITQELDIIQQPQQAPTPEFLAQTGADSMQVLANYKTRVTLQINATPRSDSAIVNLLRKQLLVALNSSPNSILIDHDTLVNLSEKVFHKQKFESLQTTLNQVSPQLTDTFLYASASPELKELTEGELFLDENGYENDQVKMAQALLIDVVLGDDMMQAFPSATKHILFALRNQVSDLSFQDEERLLIDFAMSKGADPELFAPFDHIEDTISQDLMWDIVCHMLPVQPERSYHLLETMFYHGASPDHAEPQELSVAPVDIFSALCAAPEIDDSLIARLIDNENVDIDAYIDQEDNQNNHLNTPLSWAIQDESENGPKKVDLLLSNGATRDILINIFDSEERWNDSLYWNRETIENIQRLPIDQYVQQLPDSPRKTALLEILNRHP